jgi:hypothetical protein
MLNITNVVVARWKRNVDFAYKITNGVDKNCLDVNVMIYDKENPNNPYNVPLNRGNEASAYLKYIIDNYDRLTEYTFFIHDEEYAWHHSGSILDKYKEAIASGKDYYNINNRCEWKSSNMIKPDMYKNLLKWYDQYIEKYIPLAKVPHNHDFIFSHRGAAQFLVKRDLIRNLPKEFYENLYNWILTTDIPSKTTGYYLEYTWHIFWLIYPSMK